MPGLLSHLEMVSAVEKNLPIWQNIEKRHGVTAAFELYKRYAAAVSFYNAEKVHVKYSLQNTFGSIFKTIAIFL